MGEDEVNLPGGPVLPPHPAVGPEEKLQSDLPLSSFEPVEEEEAPSTEVSAPQRRGRTMKALEFDHRPGLTNNELRQWNEKYLENMRQASAVKHRYKLTHQAKKNAGYWVLGYGIGDVGRGLGQDHVPAPLDNFSGDALLAVLIGSGLPSVAGRKRARSSSVTSIAEEAARRVRAREEEDDQVGRGAIGGDQPFPGQDEGVFVGDGEVMVIFRSAAITYRLNMLIVPKPGYRGRTKRSRVATGRPLLSDAVGHVFHHPTRLRAHLRQCHHRRN
jgi:hypothetical protein